MSALNDARADQAIDFTDLQDSREIRDAVEDAEARYDLLDELIEARKLSKLKQKQVAAAMSTSQSAISEFENGTADPHLSTLQRYARAVGKRVVVTVEPCASFLPRLVPGIEIHTHPAKNLDMDFATRYASVAASKRSDFAKAA